MSHRRFITIQEHGGRTRRIISIEVGRKNSRALRFSDRSAALKAVQLWLTEELSKHTPTSQSKEERE